MRSAISRLRRFALWPGLLLGLAAAGRAQPTVPPATGPDGPVTVLTALPDGRFVVGGFQVVPECDTCERAHRVGFLERRLPDGRPDPGFTWPFGQRAFWVYGAVLLADGGLLVSGMQFPARPTYLSHSLVRLQPDGQNDSTFILFQRPALRVASLARQPDGRILVGRHKWVPEYDTVPPLYRLTRTGRLDATFACTPYVARDAPAYRVPGRAVGSGPCAVCWPAACVVGAGFCGVGVLVFAARAALGEPVRCHPGCGAERA